jgi:hypothetical protein
LTPSCGHGIVQLTPEAKLVARLRRTLDDGSLVSIVVWGVPEPVLPSAHWFKCSLCYGFPGERIVGYQNERGNGDHKHIRGVEVPYTFVSIDQPMADFMADVAAERT